MRRFVLAAIVMYFCRENCCLAAVAFTFDGSVNFAIPVPPYSTILPGAPVLGTFVYGPNSSATHFIAGCDCVGYRQQLTNGFSATFGSVSVRADDYIVIVGNDFNNNGTITDVVTFVFDSSANPLLDKPLIVNGVPQISGMFNLSLYALDASLFGDTSLPSSLNPADFGPGSILVTAPLTPFPDIFASESGFQQFNIRAGDYNFDAVVDQLDYLQWKSAYGSVADGSADGNQNGVIDAADYTVWRNNLGASSNIASGQSVPEPSIAASVILAGTLLLLLDNASRVRSAGVEP